MISNLVNQLWQSYEPDVCLAERRRPKGVALWFGAPGLGNGAMSHVALHAARFIPVCSETGLAVYEWLSRLWLSVFYCCVSVASLASVPNVQPCMQAGTRDCLRVSVACETVMLGTWMRSSNSVLEARCLVDVVIPCICVGRVRERIGSR